MKANTINLQVVINLGNYESCRLGGEWSVEDGETTQEAMLKAREELRQSFNQLYEMKDGKYRPRRAQSDN